MIRRPPISTLTDTPFPDTTLVRSRRAVRQAGDHHSADRQRRLSACLSGHRLPAARRSASGSLPARTAQARVTARGSEDRIDPGHLWRSEEHTYELQSLMRISYAAFCLNKNTTNNTQISNHYQ